MSTPSAAPYIGQILVPNMPELAASQRFGSANRTLRRRPTIHQGRALEKLGHAIEFLYDSQVYQNNGALSQSDMEAVEILMRLSRAVFMECKEVVPVGRGMKLRLLRLVAFFRGCFTCEQGS